MSEARDSLKERLTDAHNTLYQREIEQKRSSKSALKENYFPIVSKKQEQANIKEHKRNLRTINKKYKQYNKIVDKAIEGITEEVDDKTNSHLQVSIYDYERFARIYFHSALIGREAEKEIKTVDEWKATYFVRLAETLFDDAGRAGYALTIPEEKEFLDIERRLEHMYDRIRNIPDEHFILTSEEPYCLMKKPVVFKPESEFDYTSEKKIVYGLEEPSLIIGEEQKPSIENMYTETTTLSWISEDFETVPDYEVKDRIMNIVRSYGKNDHQKLDINREKTKEQEVIETIDHLMNK
ncbi:MAG: hypothetical protein ACLFTH_01265 [Candidatus Woesearchaeota archaeon]